MRGIKTLLIALGISLATLHAQTPVHPVPDPSIHDFTGIQSFLSSDWMEGREADAPGGFMAADYISTLMQMKGLLPWGDMDSDTSKSNSVPRKRTFFQNFELIRCRIENSALSITRNSPGGGSALAFTSGTDFTVNPVPYGREAEATLVFAGYGIEASSYGYNDYKGVDVSHRIAIILNGYPGYSDSTSLAAKKLGKKFGSDFASLEQKLRVAEKHGAIAVIVIDPEGKEKTGSSLPANGDAVSRSQNLPLPAWPDYKDDDYYLPGDTSVSNFPCIMLNPVPSRLLLEGTGIDVPGFEKQAAQDLQSKSRMLPDIKLKFSFGVHREEVAVRNILGMIRGRDTTRNIIVGAHYDHLGKRNNLIYHGADDNASGTSGMLALAGHWASEGQMPPCNIIFASWTAEEKGLLGSEYFTLHSPIVPGSVFLVINMDMISRSAPEDTAHRIISIGTLPGDTNLVNMARNLNSSLKRPFSLDLWDVTGHTGSDYAYFAKLKIPVMTFFSGFHDDYHTPGDVASRTDPVKMQEILKLVNACLRESLERAGNR